MHLSIWRRWGSLCTNDRLNSSLETIITKSTIFLRVYIMTEWRRGKLVNVLQEKVMTIKLFPKSHRLAHKNRSLWGVIHVWPDRFWPAQLTVSISFNLEQACKFVCLMSDISLSPCLSCLSFLGLEKVIGEIDGLSVDRISSETDSW
jgi:hypothetical protein